MNKLKIVFFSDLHYAPVPPVNNGSKIERKLTDLSLPILSKLIYEINNTIKPDFVINLGDSIEDFNDKEKDIENLHFVCKKYAEIEPDFVTCIGNHDLRSMNNRTEVEEIFGYNHSTFSFNKNGLHIVILGTFINNNLGNEEGGIYKTQFISNEDLVWLENDLSNNTLPAIICVHFGVAEDDMKNNWWFETCPETALLGNRKELKQIIKKHKNVLAVFSGHQHWTKTIVEDNIPYHTLGSLTENINGDGVPDGVYFVATFDGKTINIKTKHIRL